MFCEKCGNKIEESSKFCEKCGNKIIPEIKKITNQAMKPDFENKWWFRFMKVAYTILYIILVPIILIVWNVNATKYNYNYYTHSSSYTSTIGDAFWYSFLTIIIYISIIRLIKISTLYIFFGLKPNWKKEFKEFF